MIHRYWTRGQNVISMKNVDHLKIVKVIRDYTIFATTECVILQIKTIRVRAKLWRTFQFCGEPFSGELSLWRTFLIPSRGARKFPHGLNHPIYLSGIRTARHRDDPPQDNSPQFCTVRHSFGQFTTA